MREKLPTRVDNVNTAGHVDDVIIDNVNITHGQH
jgi:hypothetical protein